MGDYNGFVEFKVAARG